MKLYRVRDWLWHLDGDIFLEYSNILLKKQVIMRITKKEHICSDGAQASQPRTRYTYTFNTEDYSLPDG